MKKLCFFIIVETFAYSLNAQIETKFSVEKSITETVQIIKDNKKAKTVKKFMFFDEQKLTQEDKANEGLDIPQSPVVYSVFVRRMSPDFVARRM